MIQYKGPFAMLAGENSRKYEEHYDTVTHEPPYLKCVGTNSLRLHTHTGTEFYMENECGHVLAINVREAEWLRDQLIELLPKSSNETEVKS